MKLTLTLDEARRHLADRHALGLHEVEIVDEPRQSLPETPELLAAARGLINEAYRDLGYGEYRDKIKMIKHLRALTGWSLKATKDAVEDGIEVFKMEGWRP